MPEPSDSTHPYLHVAEQISRDIRIGKYRPGDQLPSKRELLERYQVAGATLGRALDVLKRQGVVVGKQGLGLFVIAVPQPSDRERIDALEDRVDRLEQQIASLVDAEG